MIDKAKLQAIMADTAAALAAVGVKHGVQFDKGRGTYGVAGTMKFEISAIVDGAVQSRELDCWNRYHQVLKFERSDLGRSFISGGKVHTITGLSSTLRVQTMTPDGKKWRFRGEAARACASVSWGPNGSFEAAQ